MPVVQVSQVTFSGRLCHPKAGQDPDAAIGDRAPTPTRRLCFFTGDVLDWRRKPLAGWETQPYVLERFV